MILFVQQFRTPELDVFFQSITLLGEEECYFAALPLILWSVEVSTAIRLVAFVLISHYCNLFMKELIQEPRPFLLNPSVQVIQVGGYSFPSNHAQTGLVLWMGLAMINTRKWLSICAALLVLLIGFSRVYLGVHFPSDILAGWLIGGFLLFVFYQANLLVFTASIKKHWLMHTLLALMLPALLLSLNPSPHNWAITAALSGGWCGSVFRKTVLDYLPDKPGINGPALILAYGLGLGTVFLWLYGLKILFAEFTEFALMLRFVRYWVTAFWTVAGVAWLLNQLGIITGTGKSSYR